MLPAKKRILLAVAAACLAGAPLAHAQSQINLPAIGAPAGSGELSPSDERKIGEESMVQIRESRYYLDDPVLQDYLMRLGYRLVAMTPSSSMYDFLFFPLKVGEINAFALPGGFIAVFSGTILAAQDESELAGVIAHEIAHVTQRHIARMFEQSKGNVATALGSFLLAILAASAGGSSGGEAAQAIAVGSQAAMIANQLKFSRSAEQEADRIGFQSLVRAGYDPNGMARFFKRLLQRTGPYEANASAYLSDHPLTVSRIADMEDRARALQMPFRQRDNFDFELMQARALALLADGTDERTDARKRFEAALAKSSAQDAAPLHYGLSLTLASLGDGKGALEEAEKAARSAGRKSLVLELNLAEARYLASEDKDPALKELEALSERNPLSAMVAKAYIRDLYLLNRHSEIIRFLKKQEAISQENPDYYRYLARSHEALGHQSEAFQATGRMYRLLGDWKLAAYQFKHAQNAADGDFFTMSEIDADLREAEERMKEKEKEER